MCVWCTCFHLRNNFLLVDGVCNVLSFLVPAPLHGLAAFYCECYLRRRTDTSGESLKFWVSLLFQGPEESFPRF